MVVAKVKCEKCGNIDTVEYDSDDKEFVKASLELMVGSSPLYVNPPEPGTGIYASVCCKAPMTFEVE